MVHQCEVMEVWIDNQFKMGRSTPIIYLRAKIFDKELIKKNKDIDIILLSMDAWSFSFPPGSDIDGQMMELAKAFNCHVGRIINIDLDSFNQHDGLSVFSEKDRKEFINSNRL